MKSVRRLIDGPIIHPGMLPGTDGDNINGASLIAVPEWLPSRLGRFYMYFAHHAGSYIRLAYADDLAGPWQIHPHGSLRLEDAPACRDHIASPDVHVDPVARRIVMFFHGPVRDGRRQRTFVASSADGIRFAAGPEEIADFYFRTVPWRDRWIGMSKGGVAYISARRDADYRPVAAAIFPGQHPSRNMPGDVRHVALHVIGDVLQVFYTEIGGAPEQIYRTTVDLAAPINAWTTAGRQLVLAPQRPWEGAGLPLTRSRAGAAPGPEHALRDPAIFSWSGALYLLYAVAGESGIGIAELIE
ncbi:MAG: hypothetical protein WDM94_02380 [Bauldia sp.]